MSRNVTLFIATSLDGYIATPDGDLDFLSIVEQPGEDYGYGDFTAHVDTVIMGRKTYDKVLSFGIPYPHADKTSYIITRTARESIDNIHFYTGNLADLISQLKAEKGGTIFIDGGAELVNELMKQNLIDEYIISTVPLFIGSGIALFNQGRPTEKLQLINVKSYPKGLVQHHYKKA